MGLPCFEQVEGGIGPRAWQPLRPEPCSKNPDHPLAAQEKRAGGAVVDRFLLAATRITTRMTSSRAVAIK